MKREPSPDEMLDAMTREAREKIDRAPDSPEGYEMLGSALSMRGEFADAAVSYRRALSLDPHNVAAHVGLGAVLFSLGSVEEGLSEYREAIRLSPSDAHLHVLYGIVLEAAADLPAALSTYRTAIELQEASVNERRRRRQPAVFSLGHLHLGKALNSAGQRDAAHEEWELVVKADGSRGLGPAAKRLLERFPPCN